MTLAFVTFIFIIVDYIRLHIGSIKKMFLLLFGQLLRRSELYSLTGGSYLLLASLVAILIFPNPGVYISAISFLVIGDTVAALFGLRFGKTRLFRKTLAGTLACLISCLVIAYVVSRLPNKSLSLPIGIIGAFTATLVEALPVEVNDNVVIPILSGAVMQLCTLLLR